MPRARQSEAERLRRHREEFGYALRHNLTMREARQRLAQRSMFELEARVHPPLKPGCAALCGTEAPAHREAEDQAPHYWWLDR